MGTGNAAPLARGPLIWERVRPLFNEAWKRARRRRRRLLTACLLVGAASVAVLLVQHNGGRPGPTSPQVIVRLSLGLRLVPVAVGTHDRVILTMTAQHSTGVVGKVLRQYIVAASDSDPKMACVNDRETTFSYSAPGSRVRAVLDPAKGDGGPQGWCRGAYYGTVSYVRGFNCGAIQGPCHVPPRLAIRTHIVARFFYRVR